MRAIIFSAIWLIGFSSGAAEGAPSAPNPAPILLTSRNVPDVYRQPTALNNGSFVSGPRIHYVAHASGLDRIDPASMTLLGGQIGGNGVQGGAVVSLSWPTEH
jgi:hypothetical protein